MSGMELCDVQYASRIGHIVDSLPRTTPRFARRGTRLSKVWYASRTIYSTRITISETCTLKIRHFDFGNAVYYLLVYRNCTNIVAI